MFGSKISREQKTIAAMIHIYCRGMHKTRGPLCADCSRLASYADKRLENCPFQNEKTTCAKCPVHCYQREMREKIREVMRYAGPRMLRRHPVMAMLHMMDGFALSPPVSPLLRNRSATGISRGMQTTRVFIHGLESSGRGAKGLYFRQRYPDMIIEDFEGTFSQRMEKLNTLLSGKRELLLVGSSYGGLMAAVYAALNEPRVRKLVLLAPALHLDLYGPYLNKKLHVPVFIFHGLRDNVVPLDPVRRIAEQVFTNHTLTTVDDDHSLHETFPGMDWEDLLK